METDTQPRPWSCTRDGSRLIWTRDALVCPECGPMACLPAWPDTTPKRTVF
jgi:hypothetical protein